MTYILATHTGFKDVSMLDDLEGYIKNFNGNCNGAILQNENEFYDCALSHLEYKEYFRLLCNISDQMYQKISLNHEIK